MRTTGGIFRRRPHAKGLLHKGINESGATDTLGPVFATKEMNARVAELTLETLHITAENLSDQGVMPIEGAADSAFFGSALKRIPLTRDGEQVRRTYCAFWKKDNPGQYMKPFAALLKAQFAAYADLH